MTPKNIYLKAKILLRVLILSADQIKKREVKVLQLTNLNSHIYLFILFFPPVIFGDLFIQSYLTFYIIITVLF